MLSRSLTAILVVQTLLIGVIVAMIGVSLFGAPGVAPKVAASPTPYCQSFRSADENADVPGPFDYRAFYDRLPPAKGLGAGDVNAIGCPPGYILQQP